MFGDNLVEIIVTSPEENMQKIYTIEVYRRTREESEAYNQNQENDREKIKQILGENTNENYSVERTNIEVSYRTNNETMKIGVLSFILACLIIVTVFIKTLNINRR